ncbi:hypothetical protein nbrc107697_30240 [Gordonia crocea]|uniref:Uncharacterized protein n=1 Tax=Gordonia crocea TaxID=589162 RepID=A0A7I9V0R4_9ACTN|nr:hypothetical protein nbrc107697_30240 [Gordonia crocea]
MAMTLIERRVRNRLRRGEWIDRSTETETTADDPIAIGNEPQLIKEGV